MSYEHKPGEFSIFKDEGKSRDTDRDYKGSGKLLDGTDVWVSAWINTKKDGQKFLKITHKPKEQQPAAVMPGTVSRPAHKAKSFPGDRITSGLPKKQSILPDDDGDSIPF